MRPAILISAAALMMLPAAASAQYSPDAYGGGYDPMPYFGPYSDPNYSPVLNMGPQPQSDMPSVNLPPDTSPSQVYMVPPNCNLTGCADTYSSDPLDPWR